MLYTVNVAAQTILLSVELSIKNIEIKGDKSNEGVQENMPDCHDQELKGQI